MTTSDYQGRMSRIHALITNLHNELNDFQKELQAQANIGRVFDAGDKKTIMSGNAKRILTAMDDAVLSTEDMLRYCEVGYGVFKSDAAGDLMDYFTRWTQLKVQWRRVGRSL